MTLPDTISSGLSKHLSTLPQASWSDPRRTAVDSPPRITRARLPIHSGIHFTLLIFLLCSGLFIPRGIAQQTVYSHGNPTAVEQQMLELINRARRNPTQEGIILDTMNTWYSQEARNRKPSFFTNLRTEFASYPAVPPLAFHPLLIQAARAHSQDMIARNFFDHVNPSGLDPTARAAALGYGSGVGENLTGAGATNSDEVIHNHFGLMVDYDNVDYAYPLGHRLNILSAGYSEAGMGTAGLYYGGRITQDFGAAPRAYILGVAYNDTNANGAYDPGEGLSGVSVRPDIGGWFAVTSASGGFAIPIDPVQTVTDSVNLPFPVNGTPWPVVEPYDTAYRQQQIQAAPSLSVSLTWSGGALASQLVSSVTIKRPVQRNYRLTGTDGWSYNRSMVTTQNVKADYVSSGGPPPPPGPRPPRDVNGDGNADLLFQNTSGQVLAWFMDGTGGVTRGSWIFSTGMGDWRVVGLADVNADGVADLALQNRAGQVLVRLLDGSGGGIGWQWIFSSGMGDWKVVAMADINRDGFSDVVLQNTTGHILGRLLNAQGTGIGWQWIYASGLGDWKVVGMTDINGDSFPDVLLQNTTGHILGRLLNAQGTGIGWQWIYASGLGDWKVAALSDLNRDGIADLVFQNTIGQISGWLMNTTGSATGSVSVSSAVLGDWRVR
ncbi:MAG: FG-GAP-like repeat-containing protein [Chthoniobacteraceae bacterium]